jgi:hypothetical protein
MVKKLYWHDPEPILGNDYVVTKVMINGTDNELSVDDFIKLREAAANDPDDESLGSMYDSLDDDDILYIYYNDGTSEAEVTCDELEVVLVDYFKNGSETLN